MENYHFIRIVGKGSYGEVSLVRHNTDRKQYVIKKLNLTTSSRRERRAAEQEAQLLSQLRHPNIVTYRESWEGEDRRLYIVMRFCEGGDLYQRLKQQKGELLPERQVVEWFVQISMALQYLHEKRILHRDLKTQNIFLTKTNIIKVGDLGIARVLENQNDMASTLIGTPYYMSPELLSNKPYNHKSDVWALGCCVYEMATLKHAFNAKDMNSLVYRIIEGKLPQMPSMYNPQLGELIKSMLSKKPEERPDVKHILRQPYIKQKIFMFLEATKEKTAESRKKGLNNRPSDSSSVVLADIKCEQPLQSPSDHCKREKPKEEKHSQHHKASSVHEEPSSSAVELVPKGPVQDFLNSTDVSLATVSNVNIDIQPREDEGLQDAVPPLPEPPRSISKQPEPAENTRSRKEYPSPPQSWGGAPVSGVTSGEEKRVSDGSMTQDCPLPPGVRPADRGKWTVGSQPPPINMDEKNDTVNLLQDVDRENQNRSPELKESLDSTEQLLEPFIPVTVAEFPHQDPLPPVPEQGVPQLQLPSYTSESSLSHQHRQRDGEKPLTDQDRDRPLTARERRRLKQKEEPFNLGVPVLSQASYNVTPLEREEVDSQNANVCPSLSDTAIETNKDRSQLQAPEEDESGSSTSSTDHSEGDYKERKNKSNEMQDLVQLMTQTLQMDSRDPACEHDGPESGSTQMPEFRLNRRYRDTLVLYGKAKEEQEEFQLSEVPSDVTSGSAKIRRAIERLRTDVVRGLGMKLLDRVMEIMEEDDEDKRELQLQEQMGEEKYQAYAVMVRQLKFLEDVAFKE
ncbi:serine/threonine-protein kinase Nek4-like isoform X3 [Anguilla anguilla]|uniref:serine/threonine-protein kinase Nek4-like isoform X3 n=1 Tax=Anguilla anguilla TaxID=7936 RepID=UPI0015AC6B99|nr:serine/threonine-protein kinase Nek4-like isoform X3 [Anguilla anguilla]